MNAVYRINQFARSYPGYATVAAAFLALAPSTIIQMPGSREDEFAAMGELVRRVSAARLELGSDLATIAPVIKDLIRQCN